MFARAAAFSLLALPLLAVASPRAVARGSCNTGEVQCCNSVHNSNESAMAALLGLLDVAGGVNGQVGLGCSPLSVIGVGGSTCQANTVCCTNNSVGGLISIGCVPIIA